LLAGLKNQLALAFATVLGDVLLQAGDGHSHLLRQLALLGARQMPEANKGPHPVARFEELSFEPSMFRASYRQGRKGAHEAPVENRERDHGTKAKKKQILFFALDSPLMAPCLPAGLGLACVYGRTKGN
jgi:hypothetical protein